MGSHRNRDTTAGLAGARRMDVPLPSPLPAPSGAGAVTQKWTGQSFVLLGARGQPPMRTPGRHSPTDTCPAGRGTDGVEVWRERAVPSPRPGQGGEQASEEEIPAFQDTFPRASPRGAGDLAAAFQRPGPTMIYEV